MPASTRPRNASRPWSAIVRRRIGVYLELAKARLTGLVVLTTAAGYVLAAGAAFSWARLALLLAGTWLCAAGANGLNQWWEVLPDGRMRRTRGRPLPTRRIGELHAFRWALATATAGVGVLAVCTNGLTALLGALTILLYVLVYTPLKRRSTLCTLVGAICGAVPPMMGWTAASGRLEGGAFVLGATLFVWQVPHFLALAWLHRGDYERGGFRMLPLVDPDGHVTRRMVVLYSLALLPIGLSVSLIGLAGWVYAAGSLLLGGVVLLLGIQLYRQDSAVRARRLFFASIVYLPLLLGLMVADRTPAPSSQPAPRWALPATPQEPESPVRSIAPPDRQAALPAA